MRLRTTAKISSTRGSMMSESTRRAALARRVAADAGDLDLLVVGDHPAECASGVALQPVGLGHRRAQARRDVARDVVAAHRDDAGVRDAAVDVEQDVGRAAADVDDGDADLLLVVAEHGLGARQRRSSTTSATVSPQRSAHRMTFCTQLVAAVIRLTFTPRRTPLIPIGSRMPSWLSTM